MLVIDVKLCASRSELLFKTSIIFQCSRLSSWRISIDCDGFERHVISDGGGIKTNSRFLKNRNEPQIFFIKNLNHKRIFFENFPASVFTSVRSDVSFFFIFISITVINTEIRIYVVSRESRMHPVISLEIRICTVQSQNMRCNYFCSNSNVLRTNQHFVFSIVNIK